MINFTMVSATVQVLSSQQIFSQAPSMIHTKLVFMFKSMITMELSLLIKYNSQ
jgi:hypothetical protein